MPYFDENPLAKLALRPSNIDSELDLRGLTTTEALERVERLLHARQRATRVLIRFDPATNDGRETLFLPLGRKLLAARRNGRLAHCLPSADGAGYFVETNGSA